MCRFLFLSGAHCSSDANGAKPIAVFFVASSWLVLQFQSRLLWGFALPNRNPIHCTLMGILRQPAQCHCHPRPPSPRHRCHLLYTSSQRVAFFFFFFSFLTLTLKHYKKYVDACDWAECRLCWIPSIERPGPSFVLFKKHLEALIRASDRGFVYLQTHSCLRFHQDPAPIASHPRRLRSQKSGYH